MKSKEDDLEDLGPRKINLRDEVSPVIV